jgi:hypothetical protein
MTIDLCEPPTVECNSRGSAASCSPTMIAAALLLLLVVYLWWLQLLQVPL